MKAKLIAISKHERSIFLAMAEENFRELNACFVPHADWVETYFDNILDNPEKILSWLLLDGEKIGFILFGLESHPFLPRKNGVVYELYVVPKHRRKGVARAAAEMAIAELKLLRPAKIQLEVAVGNKKAAELWKSLGFKQATERYILRTEV